jgi:hypothetical protein
LQIWQSLTFSLILNPVPKVFLSLPPYIDMKFHVSKTPVPLHPISSRAEILIPYFSNSDLTYFNIPVLYRLSTVQVAISKSHSLNFPWSFTTIIQPAPIIMLLNNKNFTEVGLLASHPNPQIVRPGYPFLLDLHPRPLSYGGPYQ